MNEKDVRTRAFAMPLTSPAFPPGPYRFVNREFFIITYRTDPADLAAVVPAPLEVTEPIVKFEFIRMPDSTGFGDYTESGQVIPVSFRGEVGGYVHAMYLDDYPPIAGGRELWGFLKKLASPELRVSARRSRSRARGKGRPRSNFSIMRLRLSQRCRSSK
jgi:acetoacetate decarboxylase